MITQFDDGAYDAASGHDIHACTYSDSLIILIMNFFNNVSNDIS
jgi:hypothetical protein